LFAVEKPSERRDKDNAKQMLVGLYDYDRSESVVAVIDLDKEIVVDVRETQAQFQLSDEERREAERIAGEDSTVRDRLAGRNMNALTRLYFPTGDASQKHRHAIVFIRPSESERWFAIIDLTEGSVVDVVSRRRLAGE
jgi:hypothetical protein